MSAQLNLFPAATVRRVFHEDPGHGWIETTREELAQLGITDQITPYSYQIGPRVFLEEDCDAATYMQAMKAAGRPVELIRKVYNRDAPLRAFPSFKP